MYETWINAHFVHVRNDAPGCIAYRYEGDDESGFNFLSLEVKLLSKRERVKSKAV